MFEEANRGTLEPGKYADITVLSEDILQIDPTQISEARVLLTIMGGKVTFDASE